MKNVIYCVKRSAIPLLAGCLTVSFSHSVYSLELPTQPLLLVSSIEPNVMVVLDDSGSMVFDWYFGEFDQNVDYADCPSGIQISGYYSSGNVWHQVTAKTDGQGNAYFEYRGKDYAWGVENATDVATGLPQRCFSDTDFYWVKYSDDFHNREGDNANIYNGKDPWVGNFWNYYFSNDDQTDGDNWGLEDQKFGVGERIEIAQDAAKKLVRSIDGIRVGLGGFDGSSGGRVLAHLTSVDEEVETGKTQADVMVQQINSMVASGSTPLGETLFELGRYFIEGKQDQEIVLHPAATETTSSTGTEVTKTASSVFNLEPKYQGAAPEKPSTPVIEAYCQKNYVVMLTDGEPTSDSNVSDDIKNYASSHNTSTTSGIFDDVALSLYDIDLRPDLNEFDGTPVRNNITTFLIAGFGLSATTELNNTVKNGIGVGVDHSVTEGDAVLYQADDGDQLVESFDRIFEEIFSRAGSQTAVTFNTGSIEAGSALYQATYARSEYRWTGDVEAFPYDSATGSFSSDRSWSAAEKLDTRLENVSEIHEDRLILTYSKNNDGVEFVYSNWDELSDEQKADLKGGNDEAHAEKVINYLRGQSHEDFPSEEFRDRYSYNNDGTVASLGLLGDIVNSAPVEVGEPELNYPDYGAKADDGSTITQFGTAAEKYSSFANNNKDRASAVYVGSNDGMLHAFDGDPSTGGRELFAYIPGLLFDASSNETGLYYLTDDRYQHRFYVDGPLTASDVYIDTDPGSGQANKDWRTVLAGGLRAGGRGLYTLDVTNPSQFSSDIAEDMVLWEFGPDTAPDIGHIYSKVRFSMMNNGKWAAIVGNGYNSDHGEAKLFIIYVEEGADGSWDAGDWIEIDTNVAGDNGLSAPVLADFNGDRIVDRIYAGDLKGNLWAFDVAGDDDSKWGVAHGTSTSPLPLFVAQDADGIGQPITTQPSVILNPDTNSANNGYNALVYIGTGKLLEFDDYANADGMSFYAIWDRGDDSLVRSNLTKRTLSGATLTLNDGSTLPTRTVVGDPIDWSSSHGWFMDMPEAGERITVDPNISGGSILFTTSLPTTSACANGGTGWLISLDYNGLSFKVPTVDINGDGKVDEDDIGYIAVAMDGGLPSGSADIADPNKKDGCLDGYEPRQVANTNSSGDIFFTPVCSPSNKTTGRMSWQDLLRR